MAWLHSGHDSPLLASELHWPYGTTECWVSLTEYLLIPQMIGIRESCLVQYCWQCTVVVAIGTCCSSTHRNLTTEKFSERPGKVVGYLTSKATILKDTKSSPWWSCAGCLLNLHVSQHSFQDDLFHALPRHRGEGHWPIVPQVFFLLFLKMGVTFPFFQSPRASSDRHDFSNTNGRWLGKHIRQFLQNPGMHVIRPCGFVHIQPREVVLDLICSYSRRSFSPPAPPRRSGAQEAWETWLPMKCEAKNSLSTSAFSMSVQTSSPSSFVRGGTRFLAFLF